MEAGRTIAGGFVTPDRTLMIASTARSYLVVEKMAMGDGRYDSARLIKAVETHAQSHLLLDMDALAKQSGAMINAVMLGLVAGCGRVPIPAAAFERAIRADGKAVDANLTGFHSGLDAATKANAPGAADGAAKDDRAAAGAERSPRSNAPSSCRRRPATSCSPARGGSSPIRTWPTRNSMSTGWRRSAPPMRASGPAGA
jgi:indolepyruvate ferredoxin oxidoreductase beta subunit